MTPIVLGGDCRDIIPTLGDDSIDLAVTSPPYLRQRAYGSDDDHEIGREDTVADYVTTIADVFDLLRPKMKRASWAVLNIGDKANNSGGAGGDWNGRGGPDPFRDPAYPDQTFLDVPGQVLAELLRRGWRLRMPIVWDKGREAPEDMRHVRRPRWSHEMIYLLQPWPRHRKTGEPKPTFVPSALTETGSVWRFPPGGNGNPHLAPFPDELARRCIAPLTLPDDVVFDPFSGSDTVPRVACEMGRVGIGCELYHGREHLIHGASS